MKYLCSVLMTIAFFLGGIVSAASADDMLMPLDLNQVRVGGEIGRRIDLTVHGNLLLLDIENDFLKHFRQRAGRDGSYIGLGKLIDSAVRLAGWSLHTPAPTLAEVTTEAFAKEVDRVLPQEKPYDYHKHLSEGSIHVPRRDHEAKLQAGELALPEQGWKLIWNQHSSPVLQDAVQDFQDYLAKSMDVRVEVEGRNSLKGWQRLGRSIVVGTRDQMPGCGTVLKGPKDYEIVATPERLVVCGYDERGAMFGLYNLEARMNLREAPFLPANLKTVRHSLYDVRMVQSGWGGWSGRMRCSRIWSTTVLTASSPRSTPTRTATAPPPSLRPSFTRVCFSGCAVRVRPGCET